MPEICDVLVVGAGPAGLAAAACLRERGLEPLIVEKDTAVGAVWRRHYDRLHLHAGRRHSALPATAGVPRTDTVTVYLIPDPANSRAVRVAAHDTMVSATPSCNGGLATPAS